MEGNYGDDEALDLSAKEAVMAPENEDRLRLIEATLEEFKRRLERLEAGSAEVPPAPPAAAIDNSMGERSP